MVMEIRSGLFIPDPDPDFLPIPYPDSRTQGSKRHRIRKTVNNLTFFQNTPSQPQQQQLPAAATAAASQLEPSPRKKPRKQQLPPPSSLSISPEWVQVKREIGVRDRYVPALIIFPLPTSLLRIRIRRIRVFLGLPDPNHLAKIVRKTLIPTVLFCDFFRASKNNKHRFQYGSGSRILPFCETGSASRELNQCGIMQIYDPELDSDQAFPFALKVKCYIFAVR
jgi:hypothetical protein